MTVDKDSLTGYANQALTLLQRHALFLGIAAFGLLYAYIIFQATTLANKEPDAAAVAKQYQAVPHPKVDKEVAKTIEGLESQNVNVQTIFNQARENPFSE